MNIQSRSVGRRVLFVYPPSVIGEQMIQFLVSAQIEAAIIKDHAKIYSAVDRYPNAVLYFNIEQHLREEQWEGLIRRLISRPDLSLEVGILSYDTDPELAEKYLMDIGARGGFIQLKLGFRESARIMMMALEAAEARGERRFVRAIVPPGKGLVNIRTDKNAVTGEVVDVSTAGMACRTPEMMKEGQILSDMQLRLWGTVVRAAGRVVASRETPNGPIHVIMFSRKMKSEDKSRIIAFVRRVMQWEVDTLP